MSSNRRNSKFGKTEDYVPRFDKNEKFIKPGDRLYNPFDSIQIRIVKEDREGNLYLSLKDDAIEDFPTDKEWERVTVH